ncbi:MAG: class I SAM-dependent methyltransferase [Xanthobacteraceae bacterium]
MPSDLKPQTSTVNSRLWGARAKDWANLQEACCRPVYEAVLKRCVVSKATRYLDAGCGAGMAAQIAAERGAVVTGIDASSMLLEIARSRVPNGDFRAGDLEALPYSDGASMSSPGSTHFNTPAIRLLPWVKHAGSQNPMANSSL